VQTASLPVCKRAGGCVGLQAGASHHARRSDPGDFLDLFLQVACPIFTRILAVPLYGSRGACEGLVQWPGATAPAKGSFPNGLGSSNAEGQRRTTGCRAAVGGHGGRDERGQGWTVPVVDRAGIVTQRAAGAL